MDLSLVSRVGPSPRRRELPGEVGDQRAEHQAAAQQRARRPGSRPRHSQTQTGPSSVSATPSSAATAAGTSRAPVTKSASPNPRPRAPKPKSSRSCAGLTARRGRRGAAKPAASSAPRQTAGVMRTPAKRPVITVAVAEAIHRDRESVAEPRSGGGQRPRHHHRDAGEDQLDRGRGRPADPLAEARPGDQSRDQRHARLHQQDVRDRGMPERHQKRSRRRRRRARPPGRGAHGAEVAAAKLPAVPQRHEAEQERRREARAPRTPPSRGRARRAAARRCRRSSRPPPRPARSTARAGTRDRDRCGRDLAMPHLSGGGGQEARGAVAEVKKKNLSIFLLWRTLDDQDAAVRLDPETTRNAVIH